MKCFYPEIVGEGMGEASGVPVEIRGGVWCCVGGTPPLSPQPGQTCGPEPGQLSQSAWKGRVTVPGVLVILSTSCREG